MIKPLPPSVFPAPMSPGTYLRKRREAAGVSLELAAVAFLPWVHGNGWANKLSTPPGSSPDGPRLVRLVLQVAVWLAELEDDKRFVDGIALAQVAGVIPFEREAYDRLVALRYGVDLPPPAICRECGCGVLTACFAEGHACAWSETDPHLCTACERKEAQAVAANVPETADAS
ncbi:hypothetical protein C7451_12314 [Blastomonas natatoria]|uniref:Uncharacterized protein n=1 Tax=Blastomonas natatoria TaxID=34015 RepID=A0A2V3UPR5_9SPHN|nr:hypothetical protein [Blastomonas natatoria]PXW67878.1 hypothetical protein C7451_12314 [Blastomonas natatoria]